LDVFGVGAGRDGVATAFDCLAQPSDFDAARGAFGGEGIDHQRDAWVILHVAILFALAYEAPGYGHHVELGVESKADQYDVELARSTDRHDPSQALRLKEGNLGRRESARNLLLTDF
jgi:hypothetical protein